MRLVETHEQARHGARADRVAGTRAISIVIVDRRADRVARRRRLIKRQQAIIARDGVEHGTSQ